MVHTMRNPFLIEGPAVIAFSGGRTSGLMLYRIIEEHGGKLPDDVVPVFCNTGKEHEKTLDFVKECGERWGVRIRWIEYVYAIEAPKRWSEVDYESASRDGEPFATLIKSKGFLPNPRIRYCTEEMKINLVQRFVKGALGFDHYTRVSGLRADEPHRVARGRDREQAGDMGWSNSFPLFDAGITVQDVSDFWRSQAFDLKLPNINGTTPMGNCDICFLKSNGKVASIIAMEPQRAVWWANMEASVGPNGPNGHMRHGNLFRMDRPSYAAMLAQGTMFTDTEDQIDCACTD